MKKQTSFYPWFVVGALWIIAFLNYLDRILITSMRDPIVSEFSLTDAQFGLLTSTFLWSYGILSPFGGYLADKFSRTKVIIFSVFIWSVVTLWTGYTHSFTEMMITRILMGISEACYIPAALALITDYHKGKTRSLATGLHMSGLYTGLAIGGIGGYIAELWGWRYGFHIFGIFGILYAGVLLFTLRDYKHGQAASETTSTPVATSPTELNFLQSFKQIFANHSFYILLIYFSVLGMVNWLVYGWLPTFFKEHFHLSLGEAGIAATSYIQIGSFIGVIIGGILADRWAKRNAKGRLYVLILGFTLGAPFLFLMASVQAFTLAIIAMLIFGLARGFNDANLMPVLRQLVDNRYIATGYGMLNFLSTIIGGLMVYIGGALQDAKIGLALIYQVAAILMLLATWLLFAIKIKENKAE